MSKKLEALNLLRVDDLKFCGIKATLVASIYSEQSEKNLLEAGFTVEEVDSCKFYYVFDVPKVIYLDLAQLASYTEANGYNVEKGFYRIGTGAIQ